MSAVSDSIAAYKIIKDSGGNRYRFFCELSRMLVCETGKVTADNPEEELHLAWMTEGKIHFNQCRKCGRWVSDIMFNADVLWCVDCAPWENKPRFCPECGIEVSFEDSLCPRCGVKLQYSEVICNDG